MSLRRCCSCELGEEEEEEEELLKGQILHLCLRCTNCSSQRKDLCSELPDDVKVDILCRLPEKDLISSKFVSKGWNFIISKLCVPRFSPPFPSVPLWGLIHFEQPPLPPPPNVAASQVGKQPSHLLHFTPLENHIILSYAKQLSSRTPTIRDHTLAALPPCSAPPGRDPPVPADIIKDCCNGLLLFASDTQYYIFNPATKQRIDVPVNPNQHRLGGLRPKKTYRFLSSLVFDPLCYEFNEYKIIQYVRPASEATVSHPMEVDVFSSRTGQWSIHVVPFHPHNLYGFKWIRKSVFWDGVLYYLSSAMYLVSVDLRTMTAQAVELPDREIIQVEGEEDEECGCIGISRGSLYYSNRHSKRFAMLVWKLVAGNPSQWVLMYTINIDDIVPPLSKKLFGRYQYSKSFRPSTFHPNANEIFMVAPMFILKYHLETKEVHVSRLTVCSRTILLGQNLIFTYSRSLVVLNRVAVMN